MGRPPKHPWDSWLDGTEKRLEHGVDFQIRPQSLRQQALNEAGRRGLHIDTTLKRDSRGVYWLRIRAVDPTTATTKRGRDWDVLFKRRRAILRRGEHFTCTVSSMQVQALQAAKRRGVKIKTTTDDTSLTIVPLVGKES